jgi:hypothetical protein
MQIWNIYKMYCQDDIHSTINNNFLQKAKKYRPKNNEMGKIIQDSFELHKNNYVVFQNTFDWNTCWLPVCTIQNYFATFSAQIFRIRIAVSFKYFFSMYFSPPFATYFKYVQYTTNLNIHIYVIENCEAIN